jgi:hypothetical protein
MDPQGYKCPVLILVPMVNQGTLKLPRRALSCHHHPLQQENLAQELVPPLGGLTPRVQEVLEVSHLLT